jgi:hypothetical protein
MVAPLPTASRASAPGLSSPGLSSPGLSSPGVPLALCVAVALRRLRACRGDRRGTALIQFALAFPVFCLLLLGIMEVAAVLFVTSMMEGGLREAARFGITGFAPSGQTRIERILEIVGRHTQGLVDMSNVEISFLIYPSFNDIGEPEPYTDDNANGAYDPGEAYTDVNGNGQWDADMGAAGLGGPGDIVLYTLDYRWDLMTVLLAPLMGGDDGRMDLTASIVVRNEPFGSQAGGT